MHHPSACIERTVLPTISKPDNDQIQCAHGKKAFFSAARLKSGSTSPLGSTFIRCALWIGLFILAAPCLSSAAQVTLKWQPKDASANDFRVYQRQEGESYNYGNPAWSTKSNGNTCTIDGLADDLTYYFVVRACQGQFESDDSNEVEFNASTAYANRRPVASFGPNQSVKQNSRVNLDGNASFDEDGDPLTYQITQTAGPSVILDCSEGKCSFTAPAVTRTTALLFELTVGDDANLYGTATSIVIVNPTLPQQDLGGVPGPDKAQSGNSVENQAPLQPILTEPIDSDFNVNLAPWISTTPFEDPDEGDYHLLTQWHITDATTHQDVMDLISANDYLTDLKLPQLILDPSRHYSARVRYFDDKGLSSDWSAPAVFTTFEDNEDMNKNKIPDKREVSEHADLNNDTISDIDQPSVIKSVSTYDGQYLMGVSIENSGGAIGVEAVTNIDPKTMEIPLGNGDKFPFGLLAYKVKVSQPGDSAYTTVHFSDPIDPNRVRWMRYDSINGWQNSSGTTVVDTQGYVVERRLQDGGEEDADGVANGVIIDLSGPMYPERSNSSLTSSDDDQAAAGGGSGGGCFIGSVF